MPSGTNWPLLRSKSYGNVEMPAWSLGLDQPDVTAGELLSWPGPRAHPLAAPVSARLRTPSLRAISLLQTRDGAGTVTILSLPVRCTLVVMTTDIPNPQIGPLTGPLNGPQTWPRPLRPYDYQTTHWPATHCKGRVVRLTSIYNPQIGGKLTETSDGSINLFYGCVD